MRLMIGFRCFSELLPEVIARAVVALDRANMAEVFAAMGVAFPEGRRLRGLAREGSRMVAAFEGDLLIGYLSWGPGFSNPEEIYVDSVQIEPLWRHRGIFPRLCAKALLEVARGHDGVVVVRTDVQLSRAAF